MVYYLPEFCRFPTIFQEQTRRSRECKEGTPTSRSGNAPYDSC